MADPIIEGINLPFDEAIDFFRQKARVPTAHWDDVWRTGHAQSFMVAGAATDALLSDFQTEIRKALEEGTTLATFRQGFDAIVEKHGWDYVGTPGWRSAIIYNTNLSTAFAAGRYSQLTEADTLRSFPYWTYIHSDSSHPRPQHLAWNGMTLRADDGFWNTHYPPNGWHCGCRVSPTSEGDMGRMGKSGPDKAPPLETRTWRSRNGVDHQVPVGIDPGFDYNVGKAWQDGKAMPVKAPNWKPVGPVPDVEFPTPGPPEAAPPPPAPDARVFETRRAADKFMRETFMSWGTNLTPDENEALRDYKGFTYKEMNGLLRNTLTDQKLGRMGEEWISDLREKNRKLASALERAKTPDTVRVFRGVKKQALSGDLKIGGILSDAGFQSSTIDEKTASEFATKDGYILEIVVPEGYTGAAYIDPFPAGAIGMHREFEFLFSPGKSFRITSVEGNRIAVEALK